jgi:hypothetical protein
MFGNDKFLKEAFFNVAKPQVEEAGSSAGIKSAG